MMKQTNKTNAGFNPKSGFSPAGIGAIVLLHILIGYLLISGMKHHRDNKVEKIVGAALINETASHTSAPPEQEILAAPSEAPSLITAKPEPQPEPTPVAAPSLPVAAPQHSAISQSTDIGVVCPKQVKPIIPSKAMEDGISGTVKAEIHISSGKVVEVRILSGPKVYHAAVKSAVMRYECSSASETDVTAIQEFNFSLE
jgi:protein TonB